MNKIEALESIKDMWNDSGISLGEKIVGISTCYYSAGLSLATTAAFIKATPVEFEALLELSNLERDIIDSISEVNPPKTTWAILAGANEAEIEQALAALKDNKDINDNNHAYTRSEYVYLKMVEVSGMSIEQRVENLSSDDLYHVYKKADSFNALTTRFLKSFIPSITKQKKMGKVLSEKQIESLVSVLQNFADKGIIARNSIDGDQEICDRVLDALGKE